ncbi:hypothetical protein AAL_08198 [Moelleriella libera RCEF 2490]|uniref:Uncharacterized protein n=1 Tax=Moelleriella libera RCEF 2490 TaxID=1081109 RepID=A0A162I3B2_9HYPO|nr:hypothetical protein AAL_08198 [Moelleriella libera RCEF 2490]
MSSSPDRRSRIAHVEDADEDAGSSVDVKPGTRKYAVSDGRSSPSKANTGRSRSGKRPANSRSSSVNANFNDAESRESADRQEKPLPKAPDQASRDRQPGEVNQQRRDQEEGRRAAAVDKQPRPSRKTRPSPPKQSNTQPVIQQQHRRDRGNDPASYGVQQQPARSASRPRAQPRPASYYAGQPYGRPAPLDVETAPLRAAANPFPVGTYPPPLAWQSPVIPPGGYVPPMPPSTGFVPGFFDHGPAADPHNRLRSRFDARPASAMAFGKPPPPPGRFDFYPRDYLDEPPETAQAGHLLPRSRRLEGDRRRMPPPEVPARPHSTLPPTTPHRSPSTRRPGRSRPPPTQRRSVGFAGFDDDEFEGEESLFNDLSPDPAYDRRRVGLPRLGRSSSVYGHPDLDVTAVAGRSNRSSFHGTAALPTGGVSLDDKFNNALNYQAAVSGPQFDLTADALRKSRRRSGIAPSRSTRSSGSRDESEYRRSSITRTSYNGNDDLTIKISGNARLRVPGVGAEIECDDGGEIVFSTRPGDPRLDSDQGSMMYRQLEDNRSRVGGKALPQRARAPSQSDSQSRSFAPARGSFDRPSSIYNNF